MKKNLTATAAALALVLSMTISNTQAQTSPLNEAKKAIAASNAIYFTAFAKNNPSVFVDCYADDCMIMAPNMPALKGSKGAMQFFKTAYQKIGLCGGKFITTNVYGAGTGYVVEEGTWLSLDKNHRQFDNGKFLVLWKKTAKGWKMFRDSFSSDH
ncbi:YybH family protein [Mucilaginibacter celer]|uniref:DUF4440 domain-containing protein n=1 Tax=Mucilaginibacter celer TaxID=2305508 RepID=A0A494VVD3_9SPHI|nr:DUF4440 domain-containing protein [Mucilaginibacter celer]AYL99567.1 DUF4440 domain-containing protein [Mucilaginibacter celer]